MNREDRFAVINMLKHLEKNQGIIFARIEMAERRTVIGFIFWNCAKVKKYFTDRKKLREAKLAIASSSIEALKKQHPDVKAEA